MSLRSDGTGLVAFAGGLFFTFLIGFYFVYVSLLALWTDRNLDFWLTHFGDGKTDVHYGLAWLLTFFTGPVIWLVNIVGEIARYAV